MAEIATRIKKQRSQPAIALAIFGCIVATAVLLPLSWRSFLAFASLIAVSFFQWLLLRCVAEHLRLQKHIAGIEFDGRITGPYEETIFVCSDCGQMLHSDSRCDATLSNDEPADGGSPGTTP